MLGPLGLRIFEATGADIADLGEEHGHRVLRVCGKGTKIILVPLPEGLGERSPSRRSGQPAAWALRCWQSRARAIRSSARLPSPNSSQSTTPVIFSPSVRMLDRFRSLWA